MQPSSKLLMALAVLTLAGCAATPQSKSPGEVLDDAALTHHVKSALADDSITKDSDIDVKTYRGVVQLSGFVATNDERHEAAKVAGNVPGVHQVDNGLKLSDQERTVGTAIDDGVITTKVKAALVGNAVTKARQIDVTTSHGVVLLSGFVDSNEERDTAANLAKTVQGVQAVDNALQLKPPPATDDR